MTPQPHRGMEHCKDASVVIKGDGVAWIKCDKVVGDCLWVIANGKCPNKSRPDTSAPTREIHGFVMIDRQKDFSMWLQEHDATIRNDFLEKAEHLAQTIPDFNRMDYIHLLKESLRREVQK